jgi:acyl-coenzyme A thioesterase PaaI-like protein
MARGRVVKPGRTLTVVGVEVHAAEAERETLCATALVTFRNLAPKS